MTQNIQRSIEQSVSEDMATFLLLKAVRHAVHTNYHNLEVFATVLLKFSTVQCAKAILNDYGKCITYITTLLLQCVLYFRKSILG